MMYGEILFLGKCNCNCYYCLKQEMNKLKKDKENQLNTHFLEWENFDKFLKINSENKIDKIYLSSVETDPMLYKYLLELIKYIKDKGFKVGIRTNGYCAIEKIDCLNECNEEISFSINSLNPKTNYDISGVKKIPDWEKIFEELSKRNKKCRVSIVVNRYNFNEIKDILNKLNKYECIDYIQLRKVYKYYIKSMEDENAFESVSNWIKTNANYLDNYFESSIYKYKNLKISLWENVFSKESIESINYFTNGLISTCNLLIPAYENKEGIMNE